MSFVKGMCAGLVVGAGLAMAFGPDQRSAKREFHKAMRSMKNAMAEIGSMVGL